jgi:hypothetical protein
MLDSHRRLTSHLRCIPLNHRSRGGVEERLTRVLYFAVASETGSL